MPDRISGAAAATGLTAMAAQFLLTRELMVVALGDELNVGFVFFAWLLWVGAGSAAGGAAVRRWRPGPDAIGLLLIALGALLPLSILWARVQGRLFGYGQGELIPAEHVLLMSLIALGPVCLLTGFLYPVFCATAESGERAAGGAGRVYAWDTLGAAAGGVVFSVLLAGRVGSVGCAAAAATVSVFVGAAWLSRPLRYWAWFALVIVIAASPVWLGAAGIATRTLAWGRPVVVSVDSGYGNITVLLDGKQFSFFENGRLTGEVPDAVFGEYMAHTPLLAHPEPKRIFLMGAGPVEISEALKHGLKSVTWAELDPRLIELKEKYTPANLKWVYKDPRVRIVARDPRRFLEQTHEKFDVIVIDAGSPETIALNRYFTKSFYYLLRQRLTPDGIAAATVPFTENYMGAAETAMFGSIYKSAMHEYIPPAYSVGFIVYPQLITGPKPMLLFSYHGVSVKPEEAAERFRRRGIRSRRYSADMAAYYFDPARRREAFGQFSRNKIEYFTWKDKVNGTDSGTAGLLKSPGVDINTELNPAAVFNHIRYAASYYKSSGIARILSRFGDGQIPKKWRKMPFDSKIAIYFLLFLVFFILDFALVGRKRVSKTILRAHTFILIAGVGAAGMAMQLVLLYVFQMFYGVVYQYLGALNALFLGGAALGAAAASRRISRNKSGRMTLFFSTIFLLLVIILILGFLGIIAAFNDLFFIDTFIALPVIPLMLLSGAAVGAVFPHALNYMRGAGPAPEAPEAGALYFADLAGACVAALLVTTILIPVFGVATTLFIAFAFIAAVGERSKRKA